MVVAMVEDCAYKTNFFPLKGGVSSYYSPRAIVEKKQLNFDHHLQHAYGEYVLAPSTTNNTPKTRMIDCIYLSPSYNEQGGHELYNVHSEAKITRPHVESIPIPNTIIQLVHDLGEADEMTGIQFHTKHKKIIWDSSLTAGVDYDPDTDDEDEDEEWSLGDEEEDDISLDYDSDEDDDDDDDIPPKDDEDEPKQGSNQAEDPDEDEAEAEDEAENEAEDEAEDQTEEEDEAPEEADQPDDNRGGGNEEQLAGFDAEVE